MVGYDANGDGDTKDNGDANYAYDTDGNRIRKQVVGTGTTVYLVDPQNPTGYAKAIEEKASASTAPTRSYVFGHDIIAQSDATNGTLYFLKDGHGTTRALTNGSETVIERYDFDAYGNEVAYADSSGNPVMVNTATDWLSSDGRTDTETSLIYQNARLAYRPTGRFISADAYEGTASEPSTLHKYSYAHSNPVQYVDATGRFAEFTLSGALGVTLVGLDLDYHGAASPIGLARGLGIHLHDADPLFGSRAEHLFSTFVDHFEYATAWLEGFTEGAAQGGLNVLNGITDAFIGIVNLSLMVNPTARALNYFGVDTTIEAPDWSYGLIYDENTTEHAVSKFLGGEGAITLASLGLGALITRGSEVHHIATAKHMRFWTPLFEELFDEAGVTLENAANKVRVWRHAGPHPDMYHAIVYDELVTATAGKEGAEMTLALIRKLEELAARCVRPGDILNYLITRP
jgi:RHS repeat-associated protein